MAFDFQKLIEDPQFQLGLGLMGASSPSMAPFGEMAKQMQGIQKQKMDMEVARARLEQEKAQTEMYGQQIAESRRKTAEEARQNDMVMQMLQQSGLTGGGQTQQPQQQPSPMAAPQAQQALQQQQAQIQQQDPLDQFFQTKIIAQESKGNHYDSLGAPLTSTKGAKGIAQVLESTGPEAAKLAGVEWNRALFNRVKTGVPALDQEATEYNMKLGNAYFKKQVADFGNVPYGAAAYNAGPGATRKAIDLANKAGKPDLWLSFLPKETRDYVAATSGTDIQLPPSQPPAPPSTPLGLSHKGMPLMIAGALFKRPGLTELGKALEPKTASPGSVIYDANGNVQQLPDPIGERKVAADEARAKADADRETRLAAEKSQTLKVQKTKDFAAFDTVSSAAQSMEKQATELLANPGLDRIFGATGGLISPRLLGADARNAAGQLETLKSKVLNDALQAIRQSAANGASGYGSLTEKEGENIKNMIASLDRSLSPPEARKSIATIMQYAQSLRTRSQGMFEQAYNESAFPGLPQGTQYVKTVNGKKVFKMPDGKMVREQ